MRGGVSRACDTLGVKSSQYVHLSPRKCLCLLLSLSLQLRLRLTAPVMDCVFDRRSRCLNQLGNRADHCIDGFVSDLR